MAIIVKTDFDGACPHAAAGVRQQRNGKIVFYPGWRRRKDGLGEEAAGCGSRFSTRLINPGKKVQIVKAIVDWHTAKRTEHHDLGYIRHENESEWMMIPGRREGARVEYRLELAPGLTHFGLYPEYNVTQLNAFVAELKARGTKVEIAGRSRERRPIWLLHFPSPNPKAHSILIQARDHAYETAGSYCAEGIARWLLSSDHLTAYLREKFSVFMMPMSNPDGVFNGMSQRTWERGPRMDNAFDVDDPALRAVRRVADTLRPSVFLNLHNWTLKFTDGFLYGRHEDIAKAFLKFMPDDVAHYKHWLVKPITYAKMKEMGLVDLPDYVRRGGKPAGPSEMEQARNLLSHAISHWMIYYEELYGAAGFAMEFPWFGLNTAEMRAKGQRAFIALALALIETRKW